MTSDGDLWITLDAITLSRMNLKTLYVAASSSPPSTTYAGQMWYQTDNQMLVQRNTANSAWLPVSIYQGSSAPSVTYAGMFWYDTSVNILRQRNTANTYWLPDWIYWKQMMRSEENSWVYADTYSTGASVDVPYLTCRSNVLPILYASATSGGSPTVLLESEHSSFISENTYGYGTYQWVSKLSGCDNGEEYMGLFECHHGNPNDGLITFLRIYTSGSIKYWCWSAWGGNGQQTVLSTQDWTIEHTFKIIWDSGHVYFYIDGSLVATHTTYVPQANAGFGFEACAYRGLATTPAIVYYKANSFAKTA